VQIASLRDRKEAESIKAMLATKGLAAYIVESNLKDKGTWYRVRLGKHLKSAEAASLAAKAGKGAIVTPE
jgi:cell division protein FtsN